MSTLLMRLAGPMQSWGVQSRFVHRDTGMEPSKSGVIGLLCAALGRPREADLQDLAALTMGVRVDREGQHMMDFQTAGGTHRRGEQYGVAKSDGSKPNSVISQRYYLSDADFLVGLEGDEDLLQQLDAALLTPKWPLYLGRKSFVPGCPVRIGLKLMSLKTALGFYPWLARNPQEKERMLRRLEADLQSGNPFQLRLVIDTPIDSSYEERQDVPLSFADRQFARRCVQTTFMPLTPNLIQEESHVPLAPVS